MLLFRLVQEKNVDLWVGVYSILNERGFFSVEESNVDLDVG